MREYTEFNGKLYLKCTSCPHYLPETARCDMFNCVCGSGLGDGCTEDYIKAKEAEKNYRKPA